MLYPSGHALPFHQRVERRFRVPLRLIFCRGLSLKVRPEGTASHPAVGPRQKRY
jgi:hypothetical protein